jgi:hypothetical protein
VPVAKAVAAMTMMVVMIVMPAVIMPTVPGPVAIAFESAYGPVINLPAAVALTIIPGVHMKPGKPIRTFEASFSIVLER